MDQLYTVMIVDDEEEVREAIIHCMDWEKIGFQVIGYAENGEEALDKVEIMHPDVIMSDIQMPFMNGLTFCKRVREKNLTTKIVLFSGYDDFEYAKEAIAIEAEEYILKPIDAEELCKVFLKIKQRLDEAIDSKRNVERLQHFYEESLPILREQYVTGLLEGNIGKKDADDNRALYGFGEAVAGYAVGMIHPDSQHSFQGQKLDDALILVSIKQTADEMLKKGCLFKSIYYLGNIVVIVMLQKSDEMEWVVNILNQVCISNSRLLGVNVTAGIGKPYDQLCDIHFSYQEAKAALDYRYSIGKNQAIYIQDIEPHDGGMQLLDETSIERIVKKIKVGSQEDVQNELSHFVSYLQKNFDSIRFFRDAFLELYVEINKLARAYKIQLDEYASNIYELVGSENSLDEIMDIFIRLCNMLWNNIRLERKEATTEYVERAVEYIKQNYADSELSVERVCSQLGLSATYFSTIFKKEIGESFVGYLTRVRMEKALELLQTTQEKAYVISELVGYVEPNYFSYVFKKQYGISPSKYRSTQMK